MRGALNYDSNAKKCHETHTHHFCQTESGSWTCKGPPASKGADFTLKVHTAAVASGSQQVKETRSLFKNMKS